MVIVSILPHAEFGPNDHQEDAPHFIIPGIIPICSVMPLTVMFSFKLGKVPVLTNDSN